MSNPGSGVARIRYHVTRRRLSPPLGFVHMPKAGGTALMAEMDAVLRPRLRVGGWDASQTGGFSDFDSMQAAFRQSIARSPDRPMTFRSMRTSLQAITPFQPLCSDFQRQEK